MPNFRRVDLSEAPPMQGVPANMSGHVEPGKYHLAVTSLSCEAVKGRPGDEQFVLRMRVIEDTTYNGVPIVDRFSVPSPSQPSRIGMSRFHGFLLEAGIKIDDPDFDLDFDLFAGLKIDATLIDNIMAANGPYPERTVSQVAEYHRRTVPKAGAAPTKAAVLAAPTRPAVNGARSKPLAATTTAVADREDENDADANDAFTKTAAGVVPGVAQVAEDVSDLFDD